MTIQAQTADGALHEFPDGTPSAVIDKAMRDYSSTMKAPADAKEPTSLLGVAGLSLTDQVPAMLERGTAGALGALGVGGPQKQALLDRAKANEADYQQNLVRDPSAPTSVADAISGSSGALDAAKRVGGYALHAAAENAGPMAANVGLGLVAPESLLARGAMLGGDALMNLGGTMQNKAAHGADGDNASLGDIANAAAQTALMRSGNLGAGAGLAGRTAGSVVSNAAKGATQSILNDAGAAAQGGDFGADPAIAISSHALDAGLIGGTMGAAGSAVHEIAQVPGNIRTNVKAGSNLKAFNAETSDWNAAVQKAQSDLQAQDPNITPDDLRSQSYQAAAASGVTPPTFDRLSPQAQNGAAELATSQMYDQRLQAETAGMGKSGAPEPSTVFKGVMRDVDRNLRDTGSGLLGAGLITKDQASDFSASITEAQRHNHNAGEGGSQIGYFDTLRDKVAAFQIDPAIKNTIMMHLRVLDISSENSLKQASKGPLERNAGSLLPILGAGGAALTGGMAPMSGALGGLLFKSAGTAGLRSLDKIMGNQLPPLLQRKQAIQDYAAKNGIQPGTTPGDLMAIAQQMQALKSQAPQGPIMAAQAQAQAQAMAAANARNAPPVTSNPAGYANGVRPANPNALSIQPRVVPGSPAAAPPVNPLAAQVMNPPGSRPPGFSADPAQALAARAAPVAAPQAAPRGSSAAPAPPLPGDALQAIQASLAARTGQLGQEAQAAFPADAGGGWSRAIAQTLNVPHTEVRRVIDETHAAGGLSPALHSMLNQEGPIPRNVMSALTNHIADLRDRGMVARQADPLAGAGGSVQDAMRLASYHASVRQAEASANAVRGSHPELAPVVAQIEAESHVKDKGAALDRYLETIKSPAVRAAQEHILRPLTAFGDKK